MKDIKINDRVVLNFGSAGIILNAIVSSKKVVEHQDGCVKVYYDVQIFPFKEEPDNAHRFTEMRDVDGYFVEHEESRHIGKTNMPYNFIN